MTTDRSTRRWIGAALLGAAWLHAASPVLAQTDYIVLGIPAPKGDVDAGRETFVELRCTFCHRVTGEPDLPPPISAHVGPDLGGLQATSSMSRLATSILVPSHGISTRLPPEERQRMMRSGSAMGDYTDVLTIRQLVDLIAFLQRQTGR